MLGLGLLLMLQGAVADTTCATAALCELVARAAEVNRVPGRLAAYTARVEVEASIISVRDDYVDGPTAIQQVATDVRWERNGPFVQRAVGARSRYSLVPLSRMRFLLIGWISPLTYGERIPIFGRQGAGDVEDPMPGDVDPALIYAVHPLASDRADYYRFLGADTLEAPFPGGITRRIIRIRVTLLAIPSDRHLLVDGFIDLDAATLHTAAIRSKLISTGEPYRAPRMFGAVTIPSPYFVELVNTPDSSGTWLPATQRYEWHGLPDGIEGAAPALRITSHFVNRAATNLEPGASASFNDTPTFQLRTAPRDSVSRFSAFVEPIGQETVRFHASDFADLGARQPILVGKSRVVFFKTLNGEDVVRYNRVEGIYTGVPVTYIPGDKLRYTFFHANAGVAWWSGAVMYDGAVGRDNGRTRLEVRGGRFLAVTNQFRTQFDNFALGALLARDNWDYVERYSATVRVLHRLNIRRGSRIQVEAGWTEDRPRERVLSTTPWVGYLRPNRGIFEGSYFRTRARLDINPDISPQFVRQGWGFQVTYDGGIGALNYSLIQARSVARKDFSRAFIGAVVEAGTTLGNSIPPQQLFEVGGAVGLPGYEYKQFAGNRGILARVRLTFPIPLFTLSGGAINRALSVPRSLPSISFGYQGAATSISNPGAQAAVTALGYAFNTGTGQTAVDSITGVPLPASTASNGWKSSVDVRVGFFGGAIAVGVAKPFFQGRGLAFFLAIGGQF